MSENIEAVRNRLRTDSLNMNGNQRLRFMAGIRELLAEHDELERLRNVLRWTHSSYCTEDWTARGLHAPECLLYEIEP